MSPIAPPPIARDDDALCHCTVIHMETIQKVRAQLKDDNQLQKMAELFKICGDPSRLKIMNALMLHEMCVCDIAALMDMTQPSVSHHLKALRQTELVKYRRDGKIVYYSLNDEHVENIFNQGYLHINETR
jgi:ArsR family transcriptional regulator